MLAVLHWPAAALVAAAIVAAATVAAAAAKKTGMLLPSALSK